MSLDFKQEKKTRGSAVCIVYGLIGVVGAFFMGMNVEPATLGDFLIYTGAVLSALLIIIGIWLKIVETRASALSSGIILMINGVYFIGLAIFSFIVNVSHIETTSYGKTSELHGASWIMVGIGLAWGINLIREAAAYLVSRGK